MQVAGFLVVYASQWKNRTRAGLCLSLVAVDISMVARYPGEAIRGWEAGDRFVADAPRDAS
jgi:hypothetical protein